MKIINVKKDFGGFSLRIDGLALAPGTVYGLIGPNGCGKTTLLRIMAGLLAPDAGTVDAEGLTRREITMAPRKPYFMCDTVYRNLVYPLTIRGIKPDPAEMDYYLKLAGLKNRQRQYAPSLSAGEQQKLSLVRAMIFTPKLVLIDESFSNLDIESAGRFERAIAERQGVAPATYVICSHQLSHIQRMCERVFFMWDGSVEAEGTANEILMRPVNPNLRYYLKYASFHGSQ